MSDVSDPLSLAAEFPPATRAQWRALVDGVLKGRPFEKLTARSYDGATIEPLYAPAKEARPVAARAPGAAWQIMQRADQPDPVAANAEALHDLENGATGLTLVFAGAPGAHGFGLAPDALARVLEGVHLDAGIALELELPADGAPIGNALAALVAARGHEPAALSIRFGRDPLGAAAASGAPAGDAVAAAYDAKTLAQAGFKGPFLAADGRVVHAAGGSEAQELAFALACALAYLRALEQAGVALEEARAMIGLRLAADADELLTIAKLRALRKLWARVEAACGLEPRPAFVSAETAWRMMTRRDPYVNMLRATVATFSAAVGGADAITVLPYTLALGLPDRFARRVARNTQLVLAEESHLGKVADPAAGAGALEALTDQLCRLAWTMFQEIEAAGGVAAALGRGLIQAQVARVRAAREAAVAHRRDPLTGTSEFPLLTEPPVEVLARPPSPTRPCERGWEVHPPARGKPEGARIPLSPMRLAAPYERLRDRSDAVLAATAARPKVFLANLGKPSDFLARATFAKNLFEAGGIEAVTNDGFASHADMAEAFRRAGAELACLCASDAVYQHEAAAAAQALAGAGARHIYLAGRPAEAEAALQAAGVEAFIYAGCNVLATLAAAHDKLAAERNGGEANGGLA
ncbi:MAG: methylmalonyl-CoA mutase [Variibacter sp.]|nr:methylmalonyl-CoA mutase [Variibacter sp.]